jgi:hypothetical protein
MKLIFRFITFGILAVAIILPFFLTTENGKPKLAMPTADDFIPDKILPDSITGNQSEKPKANTSSGNKVSFYKWQDAEGVWHYGDRPPAGAKNLSTMNVNTNVNIIKSLELEPEKEETAFNNSPQPKMSETLADGELTPEDALNIMGDAKAVRDMMESRNDSLKSIVGER